MNVARAMGFFLFIVASFWDIALTFTLSFYTLCRLGIVGKLGLELTSSQGNICIRTTIGGWGSCSLSECECEVESSFTASIKSNLARPNMATYRFGLFSRRELGWPRSHVSSLVFSSELTSSSTNLSMPIVDAHGICFDIVSFFCLV